MFYIVDIGLDGMKSAMANIGLKMIMQKGDIVMASQVMEMDTVEGMLIVKQKNFFCSVGFRSPGGLAEHQETPRHRKNKLFHYYQTHKDLQTERLLQHINKRDIIRLHASSRVVAAIPGSAM